MRLSDWHCSGAQQGVVRTASATGKADILQAGATLFRVTFRVRKGQGHKSVLGLTGGDGHGNATLKAPIPETGVPETIPLTVRRGRLRVDPARRPSSRWER